MRHMDGKSYFGGCIIIMYFLENGDYTWLE